MKFSPSSKKAFVLMEVMLAAGIFAIAGVGLAVALNDIATVTIRTQRIHSIRIELDSRMDEARLRPLSPLKKTEKENAAGITYTEEIVPLELSNQDRVVLPGLYRLTFTGRWMEGNNPQEEQSEIYVYQP